MALIRDFGNSPAAVVQSATTATTMVTASFTPPAGAVLIALTAWDTNIAARTSTTTTDLGSTTAWTRVRLRSNGGLVEISWARVVKSTATRVRATFDGAATRGLLSVSTYIGAAANPIGATGAFTTGAPNSVLTYTVTASGSKLLAVYEDYSATSVPTNSGMTDIGSYGFSGYFVANAWAQPGVNGAAGSSSVQTFANTTVGAAIAYVELVPAPEAGAAGSLGGNGSLRQMLQYFNVGVGLLGRGALTAASAPAIATAGALGGAGALTAATRTAVKVSRGLTGGGSVRGTGGSTLEQYAYRPTPPVRVITDPQWRYIAQRVLTGEYLNWAVPITTEGPQWALSGPGALTGTISPQLGQLLDANGVPILQEWATAIFAEADGQIRWGGLLVRSGFNGPAWELELAGYTTYPTGLPYTGPLYERVQINPMAIVKYLWDHVQGQPDGNLHMEYDIPTNCPVRLGIPAIPAYDEVLLAGSKEWVKRSSVPASKIVPSASSTLAAAIDNNDTTVTLKTKATFDKPSTPFLIRIGGEAMTVTRRSGLKLTVSRGASGTKRTGHSKGTAVKFTGTPIRRVEAVEAEPYSLAWWDAPDVGEELDKLAQETPFDYVEEHYWDDTPAGVTSVVAAAPTASLRVGGGNLQGGYDGTDQGWMADRADDQARAIAGLGVAVFAASELHEETSADMPDGAHRWFEGRMKALASPDWTLGDGGIGGNHLLYRASQVRVLNTVTRREDDDDAARWYTDFTLQDLATGGVLGVTAVRLPADDDEGADQDAARTSEAQDVGKWEADKRPAIIVGDFGDADPAAPHPKGVLAAYGFKGLQDRTTPTNGDLDSGPGDTDEGRWSTDVLTRDDVDVAEAAGVPTNGLSDHRLWIVARVTLQPPTTASVERYSAGQGRIRHRLRISYPRAGRKRSDLAFVQGANITNVVPVARDGDAFANHVFGIGKGEGAAALRAEVAVRDGRLRRAAVYTDKAASTTARLTSEARAEWRRRQLEPEFTSIEVLDHPNARIGSWAVGDDILVRAELPWLGYVQVWSRITAWQLNGESRATLTLQRSDRFEYGASVEVPAAPVIPPPVVPPTTPIYAGLGFLAGRGSLAGTSSVTQSVAFAGAGALGGSGTLGIVNGAAGTTPAIYDQAIYDRTYYA